MKGLRLFLAASVMICLARSASAAPMMKVKMAETYVKTAEAGGFTAKSAAKEARQRIDDLKKQYGADDPDVQALDKRLQAIENKDKAAQEAKYAQQKAEQEKAAADKKVNLQKLLPGPAAVVGFTAPRPWVLEKDYKDYRSDDDPVKKYVKTLGKQKKEDVLELDKQLRARIKEARAIVKAGGANQAEAEKEIERYDHFLNELEDPVRMNSDIKIDLEKKKMDFYSYRVFFTNFSREVRFNKNDGKCYFYGDNGEPEYIRDKELPFAEEAKMCLYYINVFLANQEDPDYMPYQSKAAVSCMKVKEAIENNSPKVVIFHPISQFPKGALHDSLAKEALPLARPVQLFSNAEDVIINSNDWEIHRNKLGIIIRRVCRGWVVVKDDLGKRVIPASWRQENQGGDTYGKLQLHTYGGNGRFYVK